MNYGKVFETTDELRRQLHDFIDQLSDDDLRAMSVMIKFNRTETVG